LKNLLLATARVTAITVPVVFGGLTTPRLRAQSSTAQAGSPAFEVASVKRNKSGDNESTNMVLAGGRYVATNVTLRTLVRTAYGVQEQQIVAPTWINDDRFDITAKAGSRPATTSAFREQVRPLLQNLLADRFTLVLHHELREFRIYSLVVARRDRTLGPRLRPDASCTAVTVAPPADAAPQGPGILGYPSGPLPCGGEFTRAGRITATATLFSIFVTRLSSWTDRIVLDRTGLTGKYDWDLEWIPEQGVNVEPSTSADRSSDSGVPLFTAIQEQLGLKLESTKGPVDVLVIDHVEQPTPD